MRYAREISSRKAVSSSSRAKRSCSANNILLVVAAIFVLFGTLYPLFIDALGLGKISVGPPYFNLMFLVPMLPLAVLLGVGMHSFWKTMPGETLLQRLIWPAGLAVVAGIVVPLVVFGGLSILTAIASVIGFWVCASALLDPLRKWVLRRGAPLTRAQIGMCVAHFGVGVFILGATMVSAYNVETDVAGAARRSLRGRRLRDRVPRRALR